MATTTQTPRSGGARVQIQKFGTAMSNMIMPNIPALIAWGLLTALFIDVGWLPNADLATMVGPVIHYGLPILIAATGGRMIHGDRGAVVGRLRRDGRDRRLRPADRQLQRRRARRLARRRQRPRPTSPRSARCTCSSAR